MKKINFQLAAVLFAFFFLVISATLVSAQNWEAYNPNGRETLVDTTLLEGVIVTIEPGEKRGPFTHPAYFYYALTDGKLKVHFPDGEPIVWDIPKGMSGFSGPEGPHMPENIGEEAVKFLLVELKEHPYKATGTDQTFNGSTIYQKDATSSLAFENQYSEQEQENIDLSREWLGAFNNRNWDRFGELLEKSNWYVNMEKNIYIPSFPDNHSEIISIHADGDRVHMIGSETGTNTDSLRWLVEQPIAPTNKKMSFTWSGFLDWKDGKISFWAFYFDEDHIRKQLGLESK